MQYRILSFSRDVFFMYPFSSLTLLFVLWIHGLQWYKWNWSLLQMPWLFPFLRQRFPNACLRKRSFTWHCSFLWCLQLSPRIFNDVLVFFVTRINRINSSQISGVLKFRFLDCPFLFFYSLSAFSNSCPSIKGTYDLDVMSFGFLSVSLQTTYILLVSFVQ